MNGPGPDGWASGTHARPAGWPAPTQRFIEQRWLVDSVISQVGVDWDQGRTRYIGSAGSGAAEPDFARARDTIRKLADIEPVFAAAARRRESAAEAATKAGHAVSARTHAFVASLLWGTSEWPFFVSAAQARQAQENNTSKLHAYDRWLEQAPHPVRRLRIPFADTSLSAILHLPVLSAAGSAGNGSVPAVLHVGGIDSFKEHAVAMLGDRFLQRGMARLVFDGPGQGEAIHDGVYVSRTNMVEAGLAAIEVLRAQPEIDPARIGITGVSFGSWWATQLAARADVSATAVWAVCHENGLHSLFEKSSPTFKARFMAMSGYTDEDAFDRFVRRWSLGDDGAAIRHPYLAVAGEADELSPIEHTYGLLSQMTSRRSLIVYRGERHSIGGGAAARLGPSHLDAVADWLADRFEGRPVSEEVTVVETSGQYTVAPLEPWLGSAMDRIGAPPG